MEIEEKIEPKNVHVALAGHETSETKIDIPSMGDTQPPALAAEEDEESAAQLGFFQSDLFLSITTTLNAAIAVYSAVMATLLALFVPQLCCPDVRNLNNLLQCCQLDFLPDQGFYEWYGTCKNETTGVVEPGLHPICSLEENFDAEINTPFNNFVVLCPNCVSIAACWQRLKKSRRWS